MRVTFFRELHYRIACNSARSLSVEGVTHMDDTVHTYRVTATWEGGRRGKVSAEGIVSAIQFSTPPEFKGDSGYWTPEHFLMAAVASCYVATFYAFAEMVKLDFLGLELSVEGTLGKPEGKLRFTKIVLKPTLNIAQHRDGELANRLLTRADQGCLISRSLACPVHLEPSVRPAEEVLAH
jgi:peroxiredoxin-like protein